MPDKKLPISEFAAKLKVKYPEYKDFNDTDLVIRVTTKYPQYKDVVDLSGLSKKKEVSEPALPTGGKVGISEVPSEEGGAISKAIGKGLKTALDESKKQRQVAPKSVFGPYGLTRPSEPTAPKISQKIDAGIKVPRSKIQLESSSEVDEIEGFFNAYERGVRQGELADMMALGQTPNRENLKEIARLNKEISSIPSSAAYERFNATDNIGDAISEFIDNPFEITTQLVAESLSALVRHGYSRALAGAAVGAAAGSVVPGIGTVAGINSGYIAGIGVASYNLEMASSIMDSFREAGVDVTDEKSLTEAFDNPETLSRAKSFAQKRAVPIAIFDMFSAGMGGKLLGKPTKTMLAKLGRGVAEVGIQSGLAGAGEATAQVVSGQKINPTAIFSEMIGEVGGGAPDIAIGTMIEKTKQGKKVGEEAVKLDVKPEVLQDMLDISEGAGEITSEQSEQIKKQYEDIQKIKQSVPEEFKKNAEVIESLQQKRALEEAKKGLDPIFAKKIDEQIKALDTKIDNVISKVPAAEELTYRVDYFDPETNKMASKMFATEKEGSAFQRGLTSEQNKYGSKGYYTSAKGVGEVAPKAAPELPAAPEIGADIQNKTESKILLPVDEINSLRQQRKTDLATGRAIELERKLSKEGIKEPLVISYYPNEGKAVLTDGHNRLDVATDMGAKNLPIRIVERYGDAPSNAKDWNPPKSYFEGVGEVAPKAAPELPATQLAENFKKDFNEGALKKGEYGGARNLGVYDYQGGIVKVVKEKRKLGADQLTLMKERLGDMDNVYIPKAEVDLGEGKSAVVMDKATGIDASKLTKEDIDAIPQEHWDKFEADIRELSKRGVAVDLTKRDNFFYDKDKGFSFIDISGISIEGEPTTKFFVKDGVEMYYPLEQYPFSKKFEGGKKMFENIAEIKKEETAPEVAAPVTELPATPETQKKSIENIIKQEELDISPDQLDRLYDEAVKGGGKIEESQVRKILNVGYLRASRIAEEINDLGVREVKPEVPSAKQKPIVEVKSSKEVKQGDTVVWRGEDFIVDEVNPKGGFNLRNVSEPTNTVKDARITDVEFEGKRGEVAAKVAPKFFSEPIESLKNVESTAKALGGVDIKDLSKQIGIELAEKISESEDFETATKAILTEPNKGMANLMLGKEKEIFSKQDVHSHTYPKTGKTLSWDLSIYENSKGQKRYVLYERKYPEQIDAAALVDKDGKILQITTSKDFRKIGLAQTLLSEIKLDIGKIIPSEPISKAGKKALDNFTKQAISEAYHKAKADGSNPELVKAVEDLLGEVAPEAAPEVPATQLAENFKKDFNEGTLKKGEYGGARNLGVYDYEGGIVKVVKEKRKLGENQLTLMKERLGDMDNVYIPKAEVDLGEGKSAVVMDKATGIDASKLTKEDIDAIPQEHWDKFEADIRELSKRGVAVDLTKRDNFFYDKDKGFSFIDISGISIEGEPTTKFFVKDGVEMYYPLEQYPFSKKFEGGKKMFENIAEIKKEEAAPEVPALVTELPATPETQKKSIENIIKQEELDISPNQLDRLYDEAVKGGGKIEESQVRKILNVGYLRASRIAEEINDLGVREVKPEAAPEVPAAKIPKEIQDLYLKRATLRTTVDALKMQMGGKELAGKAKAEYEKTLSELNSIEAQISEYEQSQSIKKEPVKEQKIETLRKEEGKEPATTSNDYANYLLDLIQQKQQNLGWKDAPELREGLAKAFEQTLKERGENRAISELETTYVQYIPEGVRADAYQTIRKNYEKQKPEVPAVPKIEAADKRAEARKKLKDALDDFLNAGIVYDPRSQAEKQVRLTKAIINAIREEAIGAIKDLKKYLKENIGIDISDNDAKYLLIESKKPEYAVQKPSPESILQPEQERIREEGGERRRVESPVERVAAAQESKAEAAQKEIDKRIKAYAAPEGKQLEVNNLLNEIYKFNNQKRGRLGLKSVEGLKKRNELLIEAKRLGFETKLDYEGRITAKSARAIDKSNSNMAIDSKFVPIEKRSEKLRNLYNKIQGLSQKYGWDFQSFMPNVVVGADGKKMNNKQIANALKDLENGIPSKGANLILNDLEAMAESGYVEVRDGQNVREVPIDEYFNELERIAEKDIDRLLGEEVSSLPETDLVKWFEEMQAEQQFESEIYEEPSTEEALPKGGVEPEIKKEVPKPLRPAAAKPTGEARRGGPPAESGEKLAEAEEPKRVSGIKKALVSKEVLDKVDFERTGDKQLLAAGRQIIESGEVKPKPLVNKIVEEGKGVLTPAEVVALITYKADLDTQVENLTAEIEKMEAAGQDIGTKGVELKELELDQQNFDIAAVITAQQQSLSFRLRMWMLDSGYNLQKEISQYKKINNGTIPEDVKKRFEEYDAEIQRLKKRIKDVNAEKVDQEGEQAAANIVEDVQREGAILTEEEVEAKVQEGVQKELNKIYEQLPAKKKSRADQAIAALEKIQKRLRNRTYDAALGIPVALIDAGITTIKNAIKAGVAIERAIDLGINKIKDGLKGKPFTNEDKFRKDLLDGFEAEGIRREKEAKDSPSINEDGTLNVPERFLRQLVRDGVTTIEGMTDAVFQELQSQLPELTKRQVRDAITQYGKTVNPTKDDIRQQIGQAKRIGRLISELEDLQKMNSVEFALKYGKKKPQGVKITEAEKNLKKEIKALAKSLKTNEQNLAEAKSAAKRRIEELQRRIKEKDFSSKEKPVIKADAELEMLYSEKRDLENKFVEEKEKARLKNRPFTEKMRDVFQEITTGIPRILVAGFDLSATLVQGVRTLFTKPKIAAGGFIEGLRQFGSIERNENFLKRYRSSYNGVVAKNSGLAISDVDGKISAKDQIFVIKWANALYDAIATVVTLGHKPSAQFIKNINPLKASQRAYDGAVNYIRTRSFDEMMKSLQNDGYTPESNPEQFKAAADFINTTTGRASLGKLEGSAQWLSTVFFSPRKLASEFKLYSPLAILYYGKMPSAVRKRALANFAKFTGSVLITHLLLRTALQSLGEEQDDDFWDPDSSNFLSFKINGKTVSVLGGVKSMIVFMSRFLLGNRYVDQYGVESELGKRPAKKINTKLDLVTQFGYGKFAPTIGALADYYDQNPDYEDDDEILRSLVVPLWLQDANEIYKDDPLSMTLMFNFLSVIGANIRKVDVVEVRDKIIFKEKVNGKEVKRIVELTDDQKEEFQDIANSKFQLRLKKLSQEINSAKTSSERAEYTKMAADKAKKDAQEIMERRYKAQFRQFPIEDAGEQDKIMERVKKKLQ